MAKRNNLEFVFESLRDLGEVPAREVMAATGLSNSATTDNLRRLVAAGRVERREDFDAMASGSGTVVLWKVAEPVAEEPSTVAELADDPEVIARAEQTIQQIRDTFTITLDDAPELDPAAPIEVPEQRPASVADTLTDTPQTPARQEPVRPTAAAQPDGPVQLDQLTDDVYDPAEVERATGTLRYPEHALHLDQATVDALMAADPVPDSAGAVVAVIVHTASRNAMTVGPFANPAAARDWWHKRFNRMAADPQIALLLRPLPEDHDAQAPARQAPTQVAESARPDGPVQPSSDDPSDVLAYMQTVRPVSPAPVGEPAPRQRRTSGEPRDTSAFYRRGALSEQIAAWMREHADQTYSPTDVAKALGAQTGSVGYAMDKLTAAGTLRLTQPKPKRYQAAAPVTAE